MDEVKLERGFDLLDESGNFLGLATLYLEKDMELFTGKLRGYELRLKLLGHDNYFTADEISSLNLNKTPKAELPAQKSGAEQGTAHNLKKESKNGE